VVIFNLVGWQQSLSSLPAGCFEWCIAILPFILYGCEMWSLILRVESVLQVFKDKVLRRIFEPKKDEVRK
jgi:hypothetical protein